MSLKNIPNVHEIEVKAFQKIYFSIKGTKLRDFENWAMIFSG